MNRDYELILLAAGQGTRMGTSKNKILLPLLNKPLIAYPLLTFLSDPNCRHMIVVAKKAEIPLLKKWIQAEVPKATIPITFVKGGLERQDSVYCGLQKLQQPTGFVLIHDGARPFIERYTIERLNEKARKTNAAILGVPVKDTIKMVQQEKIMETLPRPALWQVQTPQAFSSPLILKAHQKAQDEGFLGTDDASLVERLGETVTIVEGSYDNIKITTPGDLITGEAILKQQQREQLKEQEETIMLRIGQGYDVHQLVQERPCIIGGVTLPFEWGLLGHSDADVLLHAVIDALLGAAGKGDIGHFFPDDDPAFKDADSRVLLRKVCQELTAADFKIGNIDATILAEKPKMQPYLAEMKKNLAYDCQIGIERVNVKATTSEKMGFVGRQEGIAAMAICLLEKNKM